MLTSTNENQYIHGRGLGKKLTQKVGKNLTKIMFLIQNISGRYIKLNLFGISKYYYSK